VLQAAEATVAGTMVLCFDLFPKLKLAEPEFRELLFDFPP
jgi:hypothetical protein